MRIKKDHVTKNEYVLADGVWVRNFAKQCVSPLNLSPLVVKEEIPSLMENEETNRTYQISNISDESFVFRNAVIVSDGYDFESRHRLIAKLPANVAVIAVNRALSKWGLMGQERRPINIYVASNPYAECMHCLPKGRYYPTCVASSRTNPAFVRKYQGRIYLYEATPSKMFGVSRSPIYYIDDYRNPICAAVGLAYRFGVSKLMLMCCDDSFNEDREASVALENGLYTYPPHIKTQKIIDANLFWYKQQGGDDVSVADYSSGPKYKNAAYIANEEEAVSFFTTEG